jgi:predicted DNA-binding transcriptional regulator AlpA
VAAFCKRYGIGRTKFYGMLRDGSAPRTMMVGGRRRITIEAQLEWQRAMEAQTAEAAR